MKSAFTMIELIFVIVILGILASIAVPKLGAVKTKAEATKAQTAFVTIVKDVANGYLMAGNTLKGQTIAKLSNTDPVIKINGEKCGEFAIKEDNAVSGAFYLVFTTESAWPTDSVCEKFLKDEDKIEGKWFKDMISDATGFSTADKNYQFDLNNLTAKESTLTFK